MPFFTSFSGKILSAPGLKLGARLFQFAKTLSSSVQNYNLRTDLLANGWDGVTPVNATITINPGVYVWTDSTSTAAFNTGSIVSDSIINIINQGYIMGKGGNGGGNAYLTNNPINATSGGPAISISHPVTIDNTYTSAYIGGGGGGGASRNNNGFLTGGGGGAGGGTGGHAGGDPDNAVAPYYSIGGAGGAIGQTGANGTNFFWQNGSSFGGPGGGGGRIMPGTGGSSVNNGGAKSNGIPGLGGGAGGSGGVRVAISTSTTFSSGAGGSAGNVGGNATSVTNVGYIASGGGGGWGASGGA
jgi:hypothetical protein